MNIDPIASLLAGSNIYTDSTIIIMRDQARYRANQSAAAESNKLNMIDMQRTRDGWLQNIQDMMGRMAELAVMANDGTKSAMDRAMLQAEFSQMQEAVRGITTGPYALGQFNGIHLFQG